VDQPVGLVLDKRLMGGQTAAAFIAAQPQLVTNGGFDADTNWTKGAGIVISGGTANGTISGFTTVVSQAGVLTVGTWYSVEFDVVRTSGQIEMHSSFWSNGTAAINSTGSVKLLLQAASTTFTISGVSFSGSIDNITIKAVPGNHLLQATSNSRPLWKADGTKRYLLFDGVDDFMKAKFTVTQPWERISAIRQVVWVSGRYVLSGGTSLAGVLFQTGSTPALTLFDGSSVASNSEAAVGADAVIAEVRNGASSSLTINGATPTTGNPGTNLPGGITVAADHNGTTNHANIRWYSTIERVGSFTTAERALCTQYANRSIGL
jgi:hypothetical protein